ncbi:MAG: hypothetical protein J5965_06710 [Aeriscardovia sp.]|nr:hypothetical protein [Aeriscardovia sp.]
METIKVHLSDGTVVETPRSSYVVQEWYNGKWNNMATYPPTKEGYQKAQDKMQAIESKYVQIVTFN